MQGMGLVRTIKAYRELWSWWNMVLYSFELTQELLPEDLVGQDGIHRYMEC